MPRAGEGRSIRIDPEVYEALLVLKRGNMSFSDVIAELLREGYGWPEDLTGSQSNLGDFTGSGIRKSRHAGGKPRVLPGKMSGEVP